MADASSRLASQSSRCADIKLGGSAPIFSECRIETVNLSSASCAALSDAVIADRSDIELRIVSHPRPTGPTWAIGICRL